MKSTYPRPKISDEDIDKCTPKYKVVLLVECVQDFKKKMFPLMEKIEDLKAEIRFTEEKIRKVKETEEYKQSN